MPTIDEIQACAFSSWFPTFSKHTMKSSAISVPKAFLSYLGEDGISVPEFSGSSDDTYDGSRDHDLAVFYQRITNAMSDFGTGGFFVKFNWSAPRDAAWINSGTLKCTNASDVFLLLKASDRICFDVDHMHLQATSDSYSFNTNSDVVSNSESSNTPSTLESLAPIAAASTEINASSSSAACTPFTLIVRKWANLTPSMEFRCFIYQNQLVSICQRDCSVCYPFMVEAEWQDEHVEIIEDFMKDKVLDTFQLPSYTCDVYVDKKGRVWIVDFNVFGPPTDLLLFKSWDEVVNSLKTTLSDQTTADAAIVSCGSSDGHKAGGPTGAPLRMKVVNTPAEEMVSEGGYNRGPIDVVASDEFSSFMATCKEDALRTLEEDRLEREVLATQAQGSDSRQQNHVFTNLPN